MWKWLKSLFTKDKKVSPDITHLDLTKMTKGDLKKLKAQGKIKSIYNNNK